jgi:hypothetical protein
MVSRAPRLDEEIRDLYRGPLGEFTAGRQALAKRLRQAGDAREGEVRAHAKPALSAWAVNQLFAQEPRGMAALVGAGERARAAQRRVVGGGDPSALRQAIETVRVESERLTRRGVEILTAAERAPGEAIVERLRVNLEALALNPESAPVAARGWLDEDLEPPGFEVLAGLQVAAAGGRPGRVEKVEKGKPAAAAATRHAAAAVPKETAPPRPAKTATVHRLDEGRSAAAERKERAAQERRERIAAAKSELSRAEAEAEDARRASDRAGQAAERAARDAAEAERRAAQAAERAAEARQRAEEARRKADEAAERAARGEAAVGRARESLTRAERS